MMWQTTGGGLSIGGMRSPMRLTTFDKIPLGLHAEKRLLPSHMVSVKVDRVPSVLVLVSRCQWLLVRC